jgi:hypothetical protein
VSGSLSIALVLGIAVLLGYLVPWGFIRMLAPTLESAEKARVTNYRGRPVFVGLGIVWLVWAGCAIVGGVVFGTLAHSSVLPILTLAGPLALVAFAMGVVDDAYGSGEDRGFKGHLRALAQGRLTTGGLKLVGIGAASVVVGFIVAQFALWAEIAHGGAPRDYLIRGATALVAAAAIALTSNLVNLLDLRPGRAPKGYTLLAVLGSISTGLLLSPRVSGATLAQRALSAAVLAIFTLGPVVAVWRYDLGGRGMLGDAGANSMGVVAGLLIVAGLPWWGTLGYFAVVLALNLVSERVSFSSVIERTAPLRWLDMLGRAAEDPSSPKDAPDSSRE